MNNNEAHNAVFWPVFAAISAVRKKAFINFYSIEDYYENYWRVLELLARVIGMKKLKKYVKITILSKEDLTKYNFIPIEKRSKQWGSESLFPHFNMWLIENHKTGPLWILHNDTLINKKMSVIKREMRDCDISSFSFESLELDFLEDTGRGKIYKELSRKFSVNENELRKNYLHTGILFLSEHSLSKYKNFLKENIDLLKNIKNFIYPEQEISTLFLVKEKQNFVNFKNFEWRILGNDDISQKLIAHLDSQWRWCAFEVNEHSSKDENFVKYRNKKLIKYFYNIYKKIEKQL